MASGSDRFTQCPVDGRQVDCRANPEAVKKRRTPPLPVTRPHSSRQEPVN